MTGFDDPKNETPTLSVAPVEWPSETVDRAQIDAMVKRAQCMRSDAIGRWIRHTVEDWASLLRRPGRAIPSDFRNPKLSA